MTAPARVSSAVRRAVDRLDARWSRLIARIDRVQRRHDKLGFAVGVLRKSQDDRLPQLAALIAYYSLFSVFPLLLLLATALSAVMDANSALRARIVSSAVTQIPTIGEPLTTGALSGSPVAILLGVVSATWGGLGAINALRNSFDDTWDVPRTSRPNFVLARLRSLVMLAVLGSGLVGAIVVNTLSAELDRIPGLATIGLYLGNLALNVAVAALAFHVLTDRATHWRELAPGALFAGVAYFMPQVFGAAVVRRASASSEANGTFAVVIGLLTWFFLLAFSTLLGSELNVVRARRLWPRALGDGPPTDADLVAAGHLLDEVRPHHSPPG